MRHLNANLNEKNLKTGVSSRQPAVWTPDVCLSWTGRHATSLWHLNPSQDFYKVITQRGDVWRMTMVVRVASQHDVPLQWFKHLSRPRGTQPSHSTTDITEGKHTAANVDDCPELNITGEIQPVWDVHKMLPIWSWGSALGTHSHITTQPQLHLRTLTVCDRPTGCSSSGTDRLITRFAQCY